MPTCRMRLPRAVPVCMQVCEVWHVLCLLREVFVMFQLGVSMGMPEGGTTCDGDLPGHARYCYPLLAV